jgi:hypothetical protein
MFIHTVLLIYTSKHYKNISLKSILSTRNPVTPNISIKSRFNLILARLSYDLLSNDFLSAFFISDLPLLRPFCIYTWPRKQFDEKNGCRNSARNDPNDESKAPIVQAQTLQLLQAFHSHTSDIFVPPLKTIPMLWNSSRNDSIHDLVDCVKHEVVRESHYSHRQSNEWCFQKQWIVEAFNRKCGNFMDIKNQCALPRVLFNSIAHISCYDNLHCVVKPTRNML